MNSAIIKKIAQRFIVDKTLAKKEHTKASHRRIALFFICVFMQSLLPHNQLWANNNGPNAPEAAAFEPIDATDMVNLVTGDFSYVLPLLNVPSPEGGYPLALSYHAGIAMDQEASWVGLGWSLNPGAINRSVNGVPDDWKNTRKYSVFYDEGGTITSYSGSVSVGWGGDGSAFSAGLYASYSEHQSSHGENSYRFDIGVTGSVGFKNTPLSIRGRLGTDGVGINSSYTYGANTESPIKFSTSVNQSFIDGTTDVSVTASRKLSSLGFSYNSNNGFSGGININGLPQKTKGNNAMDTRMSFDTKTLTAYIPLGKFNINAKYQKTKYWAYENDYSTFDGALYAGNLQNTLKESLFDWKVAFDSHESYYEKDPNEQARRANYSKVSYDNYSVSGQGISGSIKPYLFQEAPLKIQERVLGTDDRGRANLRAIYNYPIIGQSGDKFTKSINQIPFYFENENSSYLRVKSGNWSVNSNTYNSIFAINTLSKTIEDTFTIDDKTYKGTNANGTMRKGSYISAYTNKQIIDNPSLILKPYSFNRRRLKDEVLDGIGAYKVTASDGKTYHYSLPVYHHEEFSRVSDIDKDIRKQFSEQMQLAPYATHWLLTAVTGPDYIDVNNNQIVDKDDYGYWVGFDYGMWNEGYAWRIPASGYHKSEKTKSYQWGVKEVYYLDKIKTRTHTALFVKSIRDDNVSSGLLNLGSKDTPKEYRDRHLQSYVRGDDGKNYFNGVYDNMRIVSASPAYAQIDSKHSNFFKFEKQHSLKLSKIILLKNNKINEEIIKTNPHEIGSRFGGEIKMDSFYEEFNIVTGPVYSITKPLHERRWDSHFYRNILDLKDITAQASKLTGVIKSINFDYSYKLATQSPNSYNTSRGKLTLEKVTTRGKNDDFLIPPFKFDYINSAVYNIDNVDDWGYNKGIPQAWSMNKITTPTGGTINIEYEEDSYYMEAAQTTPSSTFTDKKGGGIRVKNLTVENDGKKYTSSYSYNLLNKSSGVTSYAPSKQEKQVKFIGEIPAPGVMYEKVTVAHKDISSKVTTKDEYTFQVLPKMVTNLSGGFTMNSLKSGEILSLKRNQDQYHNVTLSGNSMQANLSKFTLTDHTAKLGSLLSKISYNEKGQRISASYNIYKNTEEIQQGLHQETNKVYKKVASRDNPDKLVLISSSKIKLPNVLKYQSTHVGNYKNQINFDSYDFVTGQPIQTTSTLSDGTEIKSKTIPAYSIYPEMGSKVDNINNRNMLSQSAANLTQIKKGEDWKTIGANITTWNSFWNYRKPDGTIESATTPKVWRKHKNFAWKGEVDSTGVYLSYSGDFDNFNFHEDFNQPNDKWINTSTVNLYDHFSMPLETEDINGNSIATKMGDRDSKIIATCNSKYTEMFYSGAEYSRVINGITYLDGEIKTNGSIVNIDKAHTGNHIIRASNTEAFEVTFPIDSNRKVQESYYKVSVWVRKGQENNLTIVRKVGNHFPFVQEFEPSQTITAGDWVQLSGYIDIPTEETTLQIYTNGTSDLDDFRILPIESNMTSYVYNKRDELSYIIGANNLATKYEYDDAGRLKKTYTEVIDDTGIIGGFKLQKEINYHYKYVPTTEDLDPDKLYLRLPIDSATDNTTTVRAVVTGGSGEYEYEFDQNRTGSNFSFSGYGSSKTITIQTYCPKGRIFYKCWVRDKITGRTVERAHSHQRICNNDDDDDGNPIPDDQPRNNQQGPGRDGQPIDNNPMDEQP
ncbi:conserved protein of unknown function [Tenacibaculum sp. 190524A02b]|uniref:YD repeat-containing protein n=1 Tax=Tenacibaculum vairaonense TaxID=3137860 RepID=A0ABM9PHT7_9FLAO